MYLLDEIRQFPDPGQRKLEGASSTKANSPYYLYPVSLHCLFRRIRQVGSGAGVGVGGSVTTMPTVVLRVVTTCP
jgi:hypothetical protein